MSTYLIFNQLQIIHPQFRHKSRSGVLEPSQNFLSNLNVKWGYTASTDDNNIGSLADLYSSWFSSALDIDE
ncbi:neurotrimin-like isoform X2 [Vespula maculifrons]|uniref:Neurotrimin-like isoform X2 n=1 Tax=Vespula maculifrons TaxID=7453 RepID=A0ABD2BQ94_VESMC